MIGENGLIAGQPRVASPPRLLAVAARWRRLARFAMVGLSGAGVNMALLYLLVDAAHLHYLMAAAVATEAAIVSNFAFNDRWTFRDALGDRSWAARLWRYNAVALGGLAISLVVIAVLTKRGGIHYLLANLAAIVAATAWNYAVNARITWRLPAPALGRATGRPVARQTEPMSGDQAAVGES